jgi:hypothetical protein
LRPTIILSLGDTDKKIRLLGALQPRQPLPYILNLGEAGIGVLPEVEQSLVVLYGFAYYYSKFIFLTRR